MGLNYSSDYDHISALVCVIDVWHLLFIYDEDAVVLRGDARHRVLAGHLPLIVAAGNDRLRDKVSRRNNVRQLSRAKQTEG